jgi:hypothetical protein
VVRELRESTDVEARLLSRNLMIFSLRTSLRLAWLCEGVEGRAYTCRLIVLALVSGSMLARAQSVATLHEGPLSSSGLDSVASSAPAPRDGSAVSVTASSSVANALPKHRGGIGFGTQRTVCCSFLWPH